jgi:hypothetical protein
MAHRYTNLPPTELINTYQVISMLTYSHFDTTRSSERNPSFFDKIRRRHGATTNQAAQKDETLSINRTTGGSNKNFHFAACSNAHWNCHTVVHCLQVFQVRTQKTTSWRKSLRCLLIVARSKRHSKVAKKQRAGIGCCIKISM